MIYLLIPVIFTESDNECMWRREHKNKGMGRCETQTDGTVTCFVNEICKEIYLFTHASGKAYRCVNTKRDGEHWLILTVS